MKKVNTSDKLTALYAEMSKIMEERIEAAKKEEIIESIANLPLTESCAVFEAVIPSIFDTNKGKKILSRYVKAITENKSGLNAYSFRKNALCPQYAVDAAAYINEASSYCDKINKKELKECTTKVGKIVSEAVKESELSYDDICAILNKKNNVDESINYIISNRKSANNVSEYVNNLHVIKEHVESIMPAAPVESEHKSIQEMVSDLQEAINLSENTWEKEALSDIVLSNLSLSDKSEIFEKYKNECLNTINESLEESKSVEDKSRLLSVKGQIEKKAYNAETLTEDVLKLSELNYTLKN